MKKLKDEVSLIGKCEEITMMDLRKTPGEILDSVCLGKQFIITKQGKRIAILQGLNIKPKIETLEKILKQHDKRAKIEMLSDGSIIAIPK
jgi:antitoxin (DNA-binding transcriptional repressor) of toxin-antitoxin stability system